MYVLHSVCACIFLPACYASRNMYIYTVVPYRSCTSFNLSNSLSFFLHIQAYTYAWMIVFLSFCLSACMYCMVSYAQSEGCHKVPRQAACFEYNEVMNYLLVHAFNALLNVFRNNNNLLALSYLRFANCMS